LRSGPAGLRHSARILLAAGGLLVTTATAGALAQDATPVPSASVSAPSLVISTWADYTPEDLPATVEAELGTPLTIRYHRTDAEILATLEAGGDPGIDVAFVSGESAQRLAAEGLLEPIDHALVPALANLFPEASELAYDPGNVWSVPYTWGTAGLCYRTDLVATAPDSWNDLLIPAADVSGRTTMMSDPRWMLLPAQKALGFSANTTDPAQLEKVQQLLEAAQPTLLAYDDSTFYSRLVSGEAALVESWDSWCDYAIADPTVGSRVAFVVPAEGAALWADTMVIPRASRHKDAAHGFIDLILRPENHGWVVENLLYKVPDRVTMERVDPALLAAFPDLAMTPADLLKQEGLQDLGEASAARYQQIAAAVVAR